MKTPMFWAAKAHAVLTAQPWLLVAAFYLAAFRAAMLLGRWPVVWQEDPNYIARSTGDLLYWLLSEAVMMFGLSAFATVPLWLLFFICLRRQYSLRQRWSRLTIYVAGWALWGLMFVFDPAERIKWWCD